MITTVHHPATRRHHHQLRHRRPNYALRRLGASVGVGVRVGLGVKVGVKVGRNVGVRVGSVVDRRAGGEPSDVAWFLLKRSARESASSPFTVIRPNPSCRPTTTNISGAINQ